MLEKELKMGIHNRFDIEVVDAKTGKVKQRAQAFNVVCNNYFNTLCSSSNAVASNILIGTGTGTPASSDTALFNYVGVASQALNDYIDYSSEHLGLWIRRLSKRIPNNELVGQNISEIGLGTGTPGTLLTHAMLQDMNGNTITIAKTNTDVINIYCNLYLHYSGQNGDVHLYFAHAQYYAIYYGIVNRALFCQLNGYDTNWSNVANNIRLCRGSMDSDANQKSAYASAEYNAAQKKVKLIYTQVPVGSANMNGFNTIAFCINESSSSYATKYTQRIVTAIIECGGTTVPPKTITNESVGTGDGSTTKFKTKFHMPYNATVYLNGDPVTSGVTVYKRTCDAITENAYLQDDYSGTKLYRRVNSSNLNLIMPLEDRQHDAQYADDFRSIKKGEVIEVYMPEIGIHHFNPRGTSANVVIKGSNDGQSWTTIPVGTSELANEYKHFKYYRCDSSNVNDFAEIYWKGYDGYNIVFSTAPAQGDVITISYTTDYIPKDSDHVVDVSLTLTFNEYQGQ